MSSVSLIPRKGLTILFNIFFWIFNASLLLVIYIGILPFLGMALISDAATGQVPLNFFIPFFGLIGVPTACTIAGFKSNQKLASLSLFQLFYGVEAPLLLCCLLRFFVLRDLTPASSFLLVTGLVSTIATTHWLVKGRDPKAKASLWHLIGLSLILLLSIYLVAIALFFVPPFLQFIANYLPIVLIYSLIMFPLTLLLAGLGSLPFGMLWVSGQGWRQTFRATTVRYGTQKVTALVIGLAIAWIIILMTLQQQPQIQAFALLENPPQSEGDRQALVQKSGVIRKGLLNAYLSAYRYPRIADTSIYNTYRQDLKLPEESAQEIQSAYNVLTHPFQYGGTYEDREKAEKLYAQFFDTPIIRGESAVIQRALASTFNRGEAKAGLLDVNERRVHIAEQQVNIKPQGDWAEVELYEVYENQTLDQEEILYYFSLPESAVVTGIWLGNTANRADSFPFQISTRGAAQQVYNQEVSRRVDPALLEQVGSQNYRLRAFPIPAFGNGKMHLWMTYKVMKQDTGWIMPKLNERRNVYWTDKTQRKVNGNAVAKQDQWLPTAISANNAQPIAHQFTLPNGGNVLAKPFAKDRYSLPQGDRIAVVLDGSYSMNSHRQEVEKTFQWLKAQILPKNQLDLYLTASAPAQPIQWNGMDSFDAAQATFYGSLEPRQMLEQFQKLRNTTPYDAVLLITDRGSYELTENNKTALLMPAPLWLLHLDGLQPAYDDATLEAIQSSGGSVSTDVQEIMQRIGTQPTLGNGTSLLSVVDHYAWFLSKTPDSSAETDEAFAPIAARQWVTQVSQSIKPDQLQELDAVHTLAKRYQLVTPYSSMIVLVNDQQKQDLKKAEAGSDRFNREVEDQQLPQPSTFGDISAVPEPAEWMLMGVGALLLGVVYRRQKQQASGL
ncbi:MAG: TIGR02921 family PEP-CTERM protein [Timaviella obliquedivisa GSE-PSE-MK23-08B]|jgi:putative PEP-CTERM system integral membrane protein|nr:TIGR02921 family PEP-CTERM protein [Timaviella obliquedivisa GSE-PSE-MK23-08B]